MHRHQWQQADGRRHVCDLEVDVIKIGRPFDALCGAVVTPRTQDFGSGSCFEPECRDCAVRLAAALGWTDSEIAHMVEIWETAG